MKRPTITLAMKLEALKGTIVTCAGCKGLFLLSEMQFDHHVALIDGGAHTAENLRPLCIKCHKPKSAIEHKNNSKVKRLKIARLAKKEVEQRLTKSRWRLKKKMDGSVVRVRTA